MFRSVRRKCCYCYWVVPRIREGCSKLLWDLESTCSLSFRAHRGYGLMFVLFLMATNRGSGALMC